MLAGSDAVPASRLDVRSICRAFVRSTGDVEIAHNVKGTRPRRDQQDPEGPGFWKRPADLFKGLKLKGSSVSSCSKPVDFDGQSLPALLRSKPALTQSRIWTLLAFMWHFEWLAHRATDRHGHVLLIWLTVLAYLPSLTPMPFIISSQLSERNCVLSWRPMCICVSATDTPKS